MICVIVPTYNECDNLPVLLHALLDLPEDYEVLVVDDASPDGTAQRALDIGEERGRVHVLHRTGPRGYGAASKEGLLWALDHGYRIACTIDGDMTHDPRVMPQLIAAIDAGAAAAIGSRFAPGGGYERGFSLKRRALTRCGNAYARVVMAAPARDNTSGYRAYTASALREVDLQTINSDGWFFLVELITAINAHGGTVAEIPITYAVRASGTSSISIRLILDAWARATKTGFRMRFTRRGR